MGNGEGKRASQLIKKESKDFQLPRRVLHKKVENSLELAIPVSRGKICFGHHMTPSLLFTKVLPKLS